MNYLRKIAILILVIFVFVLLFSSTALAFNPQPEPPLWESGELQPPGVENSVITVTIQFAGLYPIDSFPGRGDFNVSPTAQDASNNHMRLIHAANIR